MEHKDNTISKLLFHDCNDVRELSDEELEMLICEIIDIEAVGFALDELYKRNPERAMMLAKQILENSGDEVKYINAEYIDVYLQATALNMIFSRDRQYIIDFITKNIADLDCYLYTTILDELSAEAKQTFGKNLDYTFIKTLLNRYDFYDKAEKEKADENYKWFLSSYSERIISENIQT